MLVLSRKVGESLILGNEIRIKVIEVRGGQVRLGVEAPPEISVVREELHRVVADANRQAAQRDPESSLDRLGDLMRRPTTEPAEPPKSTDDDPGQRDR